MTLGSEGFVLTVSHAGSGPTAAFLSVDGGNCVHYWDSYEFAVVVVPHDAESVEDAEKFELDQTPLAALGDWCEHVQQKRGWDIGPRVGGSLVGDLVRAVDA